MSNLSAFEIRLELLKMAKASLDADYNAKCNQLTMNWSTKVEEAKINGTPSPEHPEFPIYPKEEEIISKAQALNNFVSQIQTEPSKKSK